MHKHIDVLVVGAGPLGLMMAAQLLRHGVQPVVIDDQRGPHRTPEPQTLNARSLELFRQLGLANRLVDLGMAAYVVPVWGRDTQLGAISSGHLENPGTAFPYELFVDDEKLGGLLLARLTEKACPVLWDTRLVALRQDDRSATVQVEHQGGPQTWTCRWVVAADGPTGVVRQALTPTAEHLFARQRCLLLGEAARGASSRGGVAINTAVQDAANLAWKLAYASVGRVKPVLLHTYAGERSDVAATPMVPFARMGDSLASRIWWLIDKKPVWMQQLFEPMAQLSVQYRADTLSAHYAIGRRIRAGDRLPYLPVFDEKAKVNTDLHRWCEKPGFVLLVLGTISQHHLQIIGKWMLQKYPRDMHLYYLPYSPANRAVFEAFEVNPDGNKIVLVRPDMHIGYVNDMLNVSLVDTYMEEVIGWKPFGYLPENT